MSKQLKRSVWVLELCLDGSWVAIESFSGYGAQGEARDSYTFHSERAVGPRFRVREYVRKKDRK